MNAAKPSRDRKGAVSVQARTTPEDAYRFGLPCVNANASGSTVIQASTGAPDTPRQVRQWQIMLLVGVASMTYRIAPQWQPPLIAGLLTTADSPCSFQSALEAMDRYRETFPAGQRWVWSHRTRHPLAYPCARPNTRDDHRNSDR